MGWKVSLMMNPYFFGSIILLGIWTIIWSVLRARPEKGQVREFWWASFVCCALGFAEPLFVPAYWEPPSVLSFYRWDFESFIFCFAMGGIVSVSVEFPIFKRAFIKIDYALWRSLLGLYRGLRYLLPHLPDENEINMFASSNHIVSRDQIQLEDTLLATYFLAVFGTTTQFNLNIIYDVALVCVATSLFIWLRRPNLRWQIIGGGITFLVMYAFVLRSVWTFYPDFYVRYWKTAQLSGIWIASAPLEEYLFALTFGMLWAPFYEFWKHK